MIFPGRDRSVGGGGHLLYQVPGQSDGRSHYGTLLAGCHFVSGHGLMPRPGGGGGGGGGGGPSSGVSPHHGFSCDGVEWCQSLCITTAALHHTAKTGAASLTVLSAGLPIARPGQTSLVPPVPAPSHGVRQ